MKENVDEGGVQYMFWWVMPNLYLRICMIWGEGHSLAKVHIHLVSSLVVVSSTICFEVIVMVCHTSQLYNWF